MPSKLPEVFSSDDRYFLTANKDNILRLQEVTTGRDVRQFVGQESVSSAVISADGRYVLTSSLDNTARLWSAATGAEIRRFAGHRFFVDSAVFSPDGQYVLTASEDGTAKLWQTASGRDLRTFVADHDKTFNYLHDAFHSAVFSADGRFVLTTSDGFPPKLWDTATGREIRRFGADSRVNSAAFSSDGEYVLTSGNSYGGDTVRLWETATGREVRAFVGHTAEVTTAVFSHDDGYMLSASTDGTTVLWETATGRLLCRVMSFDDGTWAVTDPDGRYDASNGGDIAGLCWVVQNTSIDLKQLKADYYEPGLLAKIMGFNKEPLRKVKPLTEIAIHLPPEATIARTGRRATVTLTDRGGGIGPTEVFLNDALIFTDPGPARANRTKLSDKTDRTRIFTVDLSRPEFAGKLLPGGEAANQLRVVGHTFDKMARPDRPDYLASRAAYVGVSAPVAAPVVPPRIFILAAGASRYAGPKLALRFAAKDAIDFERTARAAAEGWVGRERVFSTLLASDAEHQDLKPASRANILDALDTIAKSARSTDIVLLYLSGHGVAAGSGDRDYYYVTSDADDATPGTALFPTVTISGRLLSEKLAKINAAKRAVILDTCASGEFGKREVGSDIRRSWEDMKDRTGTYILAGCAADAVSYESSRYNQGLLTYCLLEAMKANDGVWVSDAKTGGPYLDVQKWLEAAGNAVPPLVQEAQISGIQKPEFKAATNANDFYAGKLTKEARQTIKLATPLPVLLPAQTVIDEGSPALLDTLGLRAKLNDLLLVKSARGRGQGYALWRTDAQPGAYLFTVKYRAGPQVAATVSLLRYPLASQPKTGGTAASPPAPLSPDAIAAFPVTAPAAALPDAIIAEVVRRVDAAGAERVRK